MPAFATRSRQQRMVLARRRPAFYSDDLTEKPRELTMAWTTPTLVEICLGLEINGYLPAEF